MVFSTIQIVSLVLHGRLTDDRFWFHFNFNDISSGIGFFGWKSALLIPTMVLVYFFLFRSSKWIYDSKFITKFHRILLLSISFVFLLLTGFLEFSKLGNFTTSKNDLAKSLIELGFPEGKYVYPDQLEARSGKNVVVLYLESMELAYFHEKLVHLIPNLKDLSASWNFKVMTPGVGSDWSAASFYTGMYGLPAFFSLGSGGNSIFQNTRSINITGTGHVYEAAGYERKFLLGNKEFAGLEDMLKASRFMVKSENDFTTKYDAVSWGMNDIDLFSEAKKELQDLNNSSKPYVLHLATIGSHGPNGFFDPRVNNIPEIRGKTKLHKMVSATDYLVGDLVSFMSQEGYLKNTVVYIMPDHLLMGRNRTIENLGPRNLFFLSNQPLNSKDTVHQIDLPQLMLEGAGIKHNATFLSNITPKNGMNKFLLGKKRTIQALNESAVKNENLADGFELDKRGKFVTLKTSLFENKFEFPTSESVVLCLDLDHKFRIRGSRFLTLYMAFHEQNDDHFPRLIIDSKENKFFSSLHYGSQKIVTKKGENKIVYTAEDVGLVREWPYSPAFYELPKHPQYHSTEKQLLVTSSGPGDPQILTPSHISFDGSSLPLNEFGLYLVGLDGRIEYYDPENENDMYNLTRVVNVPNGFQCLMVHGNGRGSYNQSLSKHGLVKLSNLGYNMAYIAYPYKTSISEHVASQTLSFSLDLKEQFTVPHGYIENWASDPTRFIAHAGGSIDGIPYTNSLEAMDRAYQNGLRMFELDIIQTVDHYFVASHDWTKWNDMTGFKGSGPVRKDVFLANSILGKYTPLDMKGINKWFSDHPDAILVTDKINDPKAFAKVFHYPERLIMELFTLDAIRQAQSEPQIEPMASQNIIQQLGPTALSYLQNNQIKRVAVSRDFFRNAAGLCKQLAMNDIQIYIYGLNKKDQRNEAYVMHNDLPIAYGMYVEDWKLN